MDGPRGLFRDFIKPSLHRSVRELFSFGGRAAGDFGTGFGTVVDSHDVALR